MGNGYLILQHQGMDRPGVQKVPEGSGEQRKMEKTGCKIICGVPTTLAVKGLMMMMMTDNFKVLVLSAQLCTVVQCVRAPATFLACMRSK